MKKIKIFQIDEKRDTLERIFRSYIDVSYIDPNSYDMVWEDEVEDSVGLEDIYYKYNCNCPTGYKARSMSVSDIIEIDGKQFYCDYIGFAELPNKVLESKISYDVVYEDFDGKEAVAPIFVKANDLVDFAEQILSLSRKGNLKKVIEIKKF